jgi:hypothetical protein
MITPLLLTPPMITPLLLTPLLLTPRRVDYDNIQKNPEKKSSIYMDIMMKPNEKKSRITALRY